jgi:hypothetical protein
VTEVILLKSIPLILRAYQMINTGSTSFLTYFPAGLFLNHDATALVDQGFLIIEDSSPHSDTPQSVETPLDE